MDQVRTGTTYAITPTVEEIIRECDAAWERARELRREYQSCDSRFANVDEMQDALYLSLVSEHTELNKTYPVILASMAAGSYNQSAVRKFFKYVKDHPWRTQEEFIEIQSTYNLILYRKTHPHTNQRAATQIRAQTHDALVENEKKMKEQVEIAQREAEENNRRRAKGRLIDMLARVPHDAAILLEGVMRPTIVAFDDTQ